MPSLILNEKESFAIDSINGALLASKYHNLTLLDYKTDAKIVVRSDWKKEKVAVICGGGSGHEPAHVGFVGKGMLTAAVCGNLFASPSVDSVLNAILHVTGDAGCLVLIKNYTGDRLNFGLAVEKARKMGRKVDLVIIGDDISIPDNPQPRGIAGTLLIQKIAGYYAEQNCSLDEIKRKVQHVNSKLSSIGVALTSCSLPDKDMEIIPKGKLEVGLGIHGESGFETIDLPRAKELVSLMFVKLKQQSLDMQDSVILVNNLGGMSPMEINVILNEIMQTSVGKQAKRLIIGTLMTAMDMKGFSISVLKLDEDLSIALDYPVETEAWPGVIKPQVVSIQKCETYIAKTEYDVSHDARVQEIIKQICTSIINIENELNHLDAIVGDGDTGTTFTLGAKAILNRLSNQDLPLQETGKLLSTIADSLTSAMGGSSGVLLSILFTSAGSHFEEGHSLVNSLLYGVKQMMAYGGADLGDRTMVDALLPGLEAWANLNFIEAVKAAKNGAESTAMMDKAKVGRSSYLNRESLDGIKDPGAYAVEVVFNQMESIIKD